MPETERKTPTLDTDQNIATETTDRSVVRNGGGRGRLLQPPEGRQNGQERKILNEKKFDFLRLTYCK